MTSNSFNHDQKTVQTKITRFCSKLLGDEHTYKIQIPSIRPAGLVSFQLITTVANKIDFTERADAATIITAAQLQAQTSKIPLLETAAIAFAIILWLAFISWVGFLIWRIGKWWQHNEDQTSQFELRKKTTLLITILIIYSVTTSSLGPFGMWLPIPRLSLSDVTDAFLLYLLVTRYKLIEAWFLSKRENASTATSTPITTTAPTKPITTITPTTPITK